MDVVGKLESARRPHFILWRGPSGRNSVVNLFCVKRSLHSLTFSQEFGLWCASTLYAQQGNPPWRSHFPRIGLDFEVVERGV